MADESGRYRSLVLLLGVGGLRWGEAAALRPCDVDFLRRRIELHRNAVRVGGKTVVGTLKSDKTRTVALPQFVIDALAETAKGKAREALLWPSRHGGYLGPPSPADSWLAGAVGCAAAKGRQDVSPRDSARASPHRGQPGHLSGR